MSSIPDDSWEYFLRNDSFMDFPTTSAGNSNTGSDSVDPFAGFEDIDFNTASNVPNIDSFVDVSSGLMESNGGYPIYPDYANNTINQAFIEGYGGYPNFDIGYANTGNFDLGQFYGTQIWNTIPSMAQSSMSRSQCNDLGLGSIAGTVEWQHNLDTQLAQGIHEAHSCLTSPGLVALESEAHPDRQLAEPIASFRTKHIAAFTSVNGLTVLEHSTPKISSMHMSLTT
ncbi:hypothetical protein H2204_006686 [Knufia peltigerae]|uniref:Uncharacterized protein n=1 Tax=Knufia peltigerae TaxID=1002370 RepID=A0AA38Y3D7_9EURO|nr:hypothetical protein H2204_006686 [Knufia peltigerae]